MGYGHPQEILTCRPVSPFGVRTKRLHDLLSAGSAFVCVRVKSEVVLSRRAYDVFPFETSPVPTRQGTHLTLSPTRVHLLSPHLSLLTF